MYPHSERLNHISADSMTGERFVMDYGPTRVNASISWKCISYGVANSYEAFLLNITGMGLKPFAIKTPAHNDFGLGMGVEIPAAFYNGPANLKEIITPNGANGMFYDIELPYMFVKGW